MLPSGSYEAVPFSVAVLTGNVMIIFVPPLAAGGWLPPPVAAAVVNVVLLVAPQAVLAPLAFLGAIYQLYNVPAVKPVA